jgi:hypothetical protein
MDPSSDTKENVGYSKFATPSPFPVVPPEVINAAKAKASQLLQVFHEASKEKFRKLPKLEFLSPERQAQFHLSKARLTLLSALTLWKK